MEKNIVNPKALKGQDQMNHIRDLMGKINPSINESKNNSVLEISQKGPDGNIYGVVRENHEYYIKIAENKENPTVNDFKYIGGLQNKKDYVYESYAKATKQLKLKFISLAEAYGVEHDKDTNILMREDIASFNSMGTGFDNDVFTNENQFVEEDFSEEKVDEGCDEGCDKELNPEITEGYRKRLQERLGLTEDEANFLIGEIFGNDTEDLKKKA